MDRLTKEESRALLVKMLVIHGFALLFCLAFLLVSKRISALLPHSGCVMVRVLRLYCPGCGGTRAVSHLMGLRLKQAFFCHPPLLFALGILLWYDALGILTFITKNPAYLDKIRFRPWIFWLVGLGIFFVARNIALFYGYDYLGDII